MADFTKRIIFIVLYWVSGIQLISCSAPYCEWNLCSPDEICCGDDVCCPNSTVSSETFYIVAWVLSALLVLAIFCTGIFLKKRGELCLMFRRGSQSRELLGQSHQRGFVEKI